MYTKQQTFDMAVEHFYRMATPALAEGPTGGGTGQICVYRGPNGMKCLAGALIPDTHYRRYIEGRQASHTTVAEIFKALGHDPYLVREIQLCHDEVAMTGSLRWNWRENIAKRLLHLARYRRLQADQRLCDMAGHNPPLFPRKIPASPKQLHATGLTTPPKVGTMVVHCDFTQ